MSDPLRVTVWGENVHEREEDAVRALYPDGMHATIAAGLDDARSATRVRVRTATLEQPEHGLHPGRPGRHRRADLVGPHRARPGRRRGRRARPRGGARRDGSARPALRALLEDLPAPARDVVQPALAQRGRARAGVDRRPRAPDRRRASRTRSSSTRRRCTASTSTSRPPDELVFVSSFAGGEVFRGGCCFRRGAGRIFYFSPGDQDYPIYHHPDVQRVIANAVEWAAPGPDVPRAVPGSPMAPRGWLQ